MVLYILYDNMHIPLYVGITCDLRRRIKEHSATNIGVYSTHIKYVTFESKEQAIHNESYWIFLLKPKYNINLILWDESLIEDVVFKNYKYYTDAWEIPINGIDFVIPYKLDAY